MTTGLVFVSWEASWASDAEEGRKEGVREGGKMARKKGKEVEKTAWENEAEVKQRCDDIKEKLKDQRKVTGYNLTY